MVYKKTLDYIQIPVSKRSKSLVHNLSNQFRAVSEPVVKIMQTSFRTEGSLSPAIPKPIYTWIQNNPMHHKVFQLLVGGRTYNLHFYTTTNKYNYASCIQKINTWLTVASKYASARCSKHVDVYLYLTPLKKMLPRTRNQDIDEEHANTAFTTSCAPRTEIVLFREEEWFKVFIHESFHNLGLDFSETYENTSGRKLLSSMFQIKSRFRLYEVYCEMWAELINILINCKDIQTAIEYERKFALFQAAKILDFYSLNYEDLFGGGSTKEYSENTEVFCYYILKALLMYNLDAFLYWINREQAGSLQFKTNNVEKFIKDLIVPFYKHDNFVNAMNHAQSYFDIPRRSEIGTTMRMSLHG